MIHWETGVAGQGESKEQRPLLHTLRAVEGREGKGDLVAEVA